MMGTARKRIGEILLESHRVTPEALQEALDVQAGNPEKRLGAILVEMGVLTERQVIEALGLQFMLQVVNVADYMTTVAAQNEVPRDLMERLNVFPLEFQNHRSTILIAISDPLDAVTQDMLRMELPSYSVRFALAPAGEIRDALAAGRFSPVFETNVPDSENKAEGSGEGVSEDEVPHEEGRAPIRLVTSDEAGEDPHEKEHAPVRLAVMEDVAVQPENHAPIRLTIAQSPAQAAPNPPVQIATAAPFQPASEPSIQVASASAQAVAASSIPLSQAAQPAVAPSVQVAAPAQTAPNPPVQLATAVPVQPVAAAPVQPSSSAEAVTAQAGQPVPPADASGGSAIIPSFAALNTKQPRLGDVLVQAGAINDEQLKHALQLQKSSGKKLGEIFISEGMISATRLAEALSTQLKLPLFTLTRYHPMPEAIRMVPRAIAERLELIPLAIVDDDLLLIAMANPLDLLAQDEVRMVTGRNLKVGITTLEEINKNLDRLYNLQNNLEGAIEELDPEMGASKELDFDNQADDAPVIQLVSNLLQQAVREGASDIHVEAYEKSARVRFRVDGQLYTAFEYPVALHPSVSARFKIMSGMDIAEKRKPQDGRILIKVDGRRIDLRASILPTMNGEKAVLRILDQESASVGLDRLGLEPDDMEKIMMFCDMPWGIMLVTGPTGSGKSTTLYSMLQKINQPDVNIITVEDPVEFSVAGINQVHVNEKAGLTFESALRSILRQDPDKVMVGEIRDQKTAQIAIRAALTGHFVLSTLHTNDAPSAATRMIDMGVAPFLVSASLSGVIAQRLVRRICPMCREEYEIDDNTCDMLNVPHGTHAFRPKGCNECRNGYKGRRGIYEIMIVDDDLRRMILEGVSNIELRQAAIEKGMKTLRQSAINAALGGFTSIEEVFNSTL